MSVNMGTAVGYLDLDTSKFSSALKTATSNLEGFFSKETTFSQKIQGVGKSISSIGTALTPVSLAVAGIGADVINTGSKFESAMSQVAATMGKPVEAITDLRDKAIEMGSTTQFSATEAAEGLNYLALAGYDSEQQIAALPKVLQLASAGGMDLASASDMLTDSMSALGLASSDSNELMDNMSTMVDQMAKTASKSNTSVEQLGEGILTVGGTAKSLAGGTTELNTALGILADNGVKASEGGTALRNIILAMNPTTKDAKKAFEELGVATYDSQGNLRPLQDIFQDLGTAMEGMNDQQKDAYKTMIFNKTDLKSVNALLETSQDRWDELGGSIKESAGAADEMSKTQLNNLHGDFTLLQSSVEGFKIKLYNLTSGTFREVVQGITGVVDKLNGMNDAQLDVIVKIGLIVAALAPALIIVGKVITAVGSIFGAITTVIGGIKTAITVMGTVISTITTVLGALNPIALILGGIVLAVAAFALAWKTNFLGIRDKTKALVDFIKTLPKSIKTHFDNAVSKAKEFASNFVKHAKEGGSKFLSNVENGIKNLPYKVGYFLGQVIGKAVTFVVNFVKNAKEAGSKFLSNLENGIKNLPSKISSALKNGIEKAKEFAKEFPSKAKEAAKNFVEKLKNNLKNAKSTVSDLKEKLIDAIKNLPEDFKKIGKDIIDGLKNGIKAKVESAKKAVTDFASGIVEGMKSTLDIHSPSKIADKEIGQMFGQGVINGIDKKLSEGKIKAKEFASALVDAANEKLEMWELTHNKSMSAEHEAQYWNKILEKLKKGSSEYKTVYKNYLTALNNVQKERLQQLENHLSEEKEKRNVSAKLESEYWKKHLNDFKKGTDEYKTAYKNYINAKENINKEELERLENHLNKEKEKRNISADQEATYWKKHLKDFKKNSEEYNQAYKKYVSAKNEIQKEELEYLNKRFEDVKFYQGFTAKEEAKYWKDVLADFKKGSVEYKEVYKKYVTAKRQIQSEDLKNLENNLSKMKEKRNVSAKEEAQYWKDHLSDFKKNSDEYNEAYKKYIDAKNKIQSEELLELNSHLEKIKESNSVSARDEANYWKAHLSDFKKNSEEYKTVYKNYIEAKSKIQSEDLKSFEKYLSDYKVYHSMSLKEEMDYWDANRKIFIEGTDERIYADEKFIEARKKFNDKWLALDKEYLDAQEKLFKDTQDKIKEVEKAYEDAIAQRKNAILSSFNTFDAYEKRESVSSQQLIRNMETQVDSINDYSYSLDNLAKREIVPKELLKEIINLNVDATESIKALNNMTDEELEYYVSLWEQKMSKAKEIAIRENEALKAETDKKLEEIKDSADKKLEELASTYEDNLVELGVISKESATNASDGIIDALTNGISNAIPDVESVFLSLETTVISSLSGLAEKSKALLSDIMSQVTKAKSLVGDSIVSENQTNENVASLGVIKVVDKETGELTNETNITNNFYGTPPLDEKETARQMKLAYQQLSLGLV